MRAGKFLIVNEPSIESVDQKLKVAAENCDIFPAQVYVPKHYKSDKGCYCVVASLAHIVILGVMTWFYSWGYLLTIGIEIAFFAMYSKEHVFVLTVQIFYLAATLMATTAVMIISLLPETSGIRNDFSLFIPTLKKAILIPMALFFGFFLCLRLLLISWYRTHLFFNNLRDKFATEKVILQPI